MAGKGDKARNNFSKAFFTHYDEIDFDAGTARCADCGKKIYTPNSEAHQLRDFEGNIVIVCNKNRPCK